MTVSLMPREQMMYVETVETIHNLTLAAGYRVLTDDTFKLWNRILPAVPLQPLARPVPRSESRSVTGSSLASLMSNFPFA